jgi:hypothetical protein
MKRVMLALLGLLFAASLMAQDRPPRIERGNATQEMQAGGLSAAHSSIPIGSKARINNPANGLDIEVTIIDQIPEWPRRIVDLSPGAALALDLGPGGPVILTPTSIAQSIPSNADIKVDATPETETALEKLTQPFNIIINNYLMNPDKPEQPPAPVPQAAPVTPAPVTPQQTAPVQQVAAPSPQTAPPTQEYRERPTRRNRGPYGGYEPDPYYGEETRENPYMAPPVQPEPPAPSLYTSPPVNNIRIIPGLPDPHGNKVYRLLVGTYQGVENAFRVHLQLQAAGFEVAQEQAGDMCRLFAANIPASRVYYAAQRLGAIGFEQVWIHE